ncbi:hypothetical protein [Nocardia sp. NPDC051833]|uniref:hypothetical protein n=1 Tax=Nocardia sp. NPDC051833 TaxID=3155674 RepID=UPI00344844A2
MPILIGGIVVGGVAVAPRGMRLSGRGVAGLGGVAVLLGIAFVLVPGIVAGWGSEGGIGSEGELRRALRVAFAGYWSSGDGEFSPALNDVVEYWFRYHLVKGLIAVVLLGVLAVLAAVLWDAVGRDSDAGCVRRLVLGTAGAVVTLFAVLALLAVMANAQGAVAPYASVLPMLFDDPVGPELAGTLAEVNQQLAVSAEVGSSPALEVMIDDFTRYHVAMVVISSVVAVGFGIATMVLWTRRAGKSSGERAVLAGLGLLAMGLAVVFAVVAVANTTTVAEPLPALQALFDGGW